MVWDLKTLEQLNEEAIDPWVVELEEGVWLANWEGDPGRTLDIDHAMRFSSSIMASEALKKACGYRPFKNGRVKKAGRKPRYMIINRSAGFVGNSPQFWAQDGCGYTIWINEAEVFTEREAARVVRGCRGSHMLEVVEADLIRKIAKPAVDMQELRRLYESECEGGQQCD